MEIFLCYLLIPLFFFVINFGLLKNILILFSYSIE